MNRVIGSNTRQKNRVLVMVKHLEIDNRIWDEYKINKALTLKNPILIKFLNEISWFQASFVPMHIGTEKFCNSFVTVVLPVWRCMTINNNSSSFLLYRNHFETVSWEKFLRHFRNRCYYYNYFPNIAIRHLIFMGRVLGGLLPNIDDLYTHHLIILMHMECIVWMSSVNLYLALWTGCVT